MHSRNWSTVKRNPCLSAMMAWVTMLMRCPFVPCCASYCGSLRKACRPTAPVRRSGFHPPVRTEPERAVHFHVCVLSAAQLRDLHSGCLARACGLVTMRQRPQTVKGVTFVTIEDETGSVNVIVWRSLQKKQRTELLRSRLLAVHGV